MGQSSGLVVRGCLSFHREPCLSHLAPVLVDYPDPDVISYMASMLEEYSEGVEDDLLG